MHLLRPDHWKAMPPRRKVAWCLGGVVGAVVLWACFWRVPTEVMGKGVLLLPGSAGLIDARAGGQVTFVARVGRDAYGDQSIEHLAIQMANGQARLVEEEAKVSLLDRAWGAVMKTLSGFTSGKPKEAVA